jgi:hypothetical protein
MKMKYLKSSQMGVSQILSLEQAQDELKEFFENAMLKDAIAYKVVEMTEEELEKLPEFQGY